MDQATPPIEARDIWLRMRAAVTSAAYPARIRYTIRVSGVDASNTVTPHYEASSDTTNGEIRLSSISDEEVMNPPIPRGFTFGFGYCSSICRPAIVVGHPPPVEDILGEPLLTPTYTFGIRYHELNDSTPETGKGDLKVIATVSTALDYAVTLVDVPAIDGIATYHIKLIPLHDPKVYRLRELWVGTKDGLPRRARVAGNFTDAPMVDVRWTIDFSVVNGAPYIIREAALTTLEMSHRRVVNHAEVAFENIRRPDGIYHQPLITPIEKVDTLEEPGM